MEDEDAPLFPNYTETTKVLPTWAWHVLRAAGVLTLIALVGLAMKREPVALAILWGLFIPVLPLVFMALPGLWRNLCPLATVNQVPRLLGIGAALSLPVWLRRYAPIIGMVALFAIIPARKLIFDTNGTAVAWGVASLLGLALLGGFIFKGKSGWCGSFCPMLPIQRLYGQTPLLTISNSHCQPCVGCTRNCYDFNPQVAWLADLNDAEQRYGTDRKLFAGAMPGLLWAYFTLPNTPDVTPLALYAGFAMYVLIGIGAFYTLDALVRSSHHKLTTIFAVISINIFYWFAAVSMENTINELSQQQLNASIVWSVRTAVLILSIVWLVKTWRKEALFYEQLLASQDMRVASAKPLRKRKQEQGSKPEIVVMPDEKRIVIEQGKSLLELFEGGEVPIEAGCRMGVCGADPVEIVEGMENLSAMTSDERGTLERLGYDENVRMACCARVKGPVCVSLSPQRTGRRAASEPTFKPDMEVNKVVIIGNGIAGVTTAEAVRKHHPDCEIHIIGNEQHPLYNRMGISRLIYGRSAMGGLYLLPDTWYEEQEITTWLNTRATEINIGANWVRLGTGETLPFDRLVLAMGSEAFVPPVQNFGWDGNFVLREAADAMQLRAYVQEHTVRHAVVAGGGLLGLEAAYALIRLGLRVTVLERGPYLLRRQLDSRAARHLQTYLEGLGITILHHAEADSVWGDARVEEVVLKNGRRFAAEMLLVAVGVRPRLDLVKDLPIKVEQGVSVDQYMRTRVPTVYAVGDIAQPSAGTMDGLWPTAVSQAEVAGVNVAGGDRTYQGRPPVTALKVVGVDLLSVGIVQPRDKNDAEIALENKKRRRYRKLVVNGSRIIGGILFGYPEYSDGLKAAINEKQDMTPHLKTLHSGDWDSLKQ